jgi:hypothetical protein
MLRAYSSLGRTRERYACDFIFVLEVLRFLFKNQKLLFAPSLSGWLDLLHCPTLLWRALTVVVSFTLRNFAIKLRWSNDGQLGMPATDIIILAASQICYKLSPDLHYLFTISFLFKFVIADG